MKSLVGNFVVSPISATLDMNLRNLLYYSADSEDWSFNRFFVSAVGPMTDVIVKTATIVPEMREMPRITNFIRPEIVQKIIS